MTCPRCQARVPKGVHACLKCGTNLQGTLTDSESPLRTVYLLATVAAILFCAGALMMVNGNSKAHAGSAPNVVERSVGSTSLTPQSSLPATSNVVALTSPGNRQSNLNSAPNPGPRASSDDAAPDDSTDITSQNEAPNAYDQYLNQIQYPGQAVDDAMNNFDRITTAKERTDAPLSITEDQEISDDIGKLQTARLAFRSFQPDPDFVRLRDLTVQTIDATMDVADRFRMYLKTNQSFEDATLQRDAQQLAALKQEVAAEMDRLRAKYP